MSPLGHAFGWKKVSSAQLTASAWASNLYIMLNIFFFEVIKIQLSGNAWSDPAPEESSSKVNLIGSPCLNPPTQIGTSTNFYEVKETVLSQPSVNWHKGLRIPSFYWTALISRLLSWIFLLLYNPVLTITEFEVRKELRQIYIGVHSCQTVAFSSETRFEKNSNWGQE